MLNQYMDKTYVDFIDKYYEIFPEIKTFMDNTIKSCQEKGYVETIFKRIWPNVTPTSAAEKKITFFTSWS